jgi:hypothetical protein
VYGYGTWRKLSFILRQYTTVFQTEMYAIRACAAENIDRGYRNRNIYIVTWGLTARIVKPDEQPLLGNGCVNKQQYQSHH